MQLKVTAFSASSISSRLCSNRDKFSSETEKKKNVSGHHCEEALLGLPKIATQVVVVTQLSPL